MSYYARTLTLAGLLVGGTASAHAIQGPTEDCQPSHGHSDGGLLGDLGFLPSQVADKDIVPANHYENGSWDNDADGVRNDRNALPNDRRDTSDRDGDGVGDNVDHFPDDPKEYFDADADGIGDNADTEWTGPARIFSVKSWMGDGRYGQSIGFDMIFDTKGHLTVVTRVKLSGARDAAREAEWEKRTEEVWTTEHMSVDVEWVPSNGSGQHTTVRVSNGSGRANTRQFYTSSGGGTVAHEIGHHLGLLDEYYDSQDRARMLGENDSIMRNSRSNSSQAYPRHIAFIRSFYNPKDSRPYTGPIPQTGVVPKTPQVDNPVPVAHPDTGRLWVECPKGYSKYLASGDAWKQSICRSNANSKEYIGYHDGKWWTWDHHEPENILAMYDPKTGEKKNIHADDLAIVVYDKSQLPEGGEPEVKPDEKPDEKPDDKPVVDAVAVVEDREEDTDSKPNRGFTLIDETQGGRAINLRNLLTPSKEGGLFSRRDRFSQSSATGYTPNASGDTP